MKKLSITIVSILLFGCANTNDRIVEKTAFYLNVKPSEVKLISAEKNMLDTKWQVETNGKIYNCIADDMLRGITCK